MAKAEGHYDAITACIHSLERVSFQSEMHSIHQARLNFVTMLTGALSKASHIAQRGKKTIVRFSLQVPTSFMHWFLSQYSSHYISMDHSKTKQVLLQREADAKPIEQPRRLIVVKPASITDPILSNAFGDFWWFTASVPGVGFSDRGDLSQREHIFLIPMEPDAEFSFDTTCGLMEFKSTFTRTTFRREHLSAYAEEEAKHAAEYETHLVGKQFLCNEIEGSL